ncbi:glycosyltransferase [Patescibacteria group bacterium]|nr:glycosyltransferase [Patescibacteria group bacterium]
MIKNTNKPIISLFVHCYPPAKGGAEFLSSEIKKILDEKFEVHVFTGQGLSLDSYKTFNNFFTDKDNPTIHRLELNFQQQRLANKFLYRPVTKFGILSHLFFGPILKYTQDDLDIIRSSDYLFGIAFPTKAIWDAYRFALDFNKKLFVLPAYHNVSYYNHSPFFQQALNFATKIIFLTSFEKEKLSNNYHISDTQSIINTYCPYSKKQIALQKTKNAKRKYDFSHPTIGYVGQICERKNLYLFDSLLQANFKVIFAGARNNGSSAIEKHFKKYLDSKQLTIIYDFPDKEKEKIFNLMDIFINPSIEESLGIVNFESIYYGTPIIINQESAFISLPSKIPSFNNKLTSDLVSSFSRTQIDIQYSLFKNYNLDSFADNLYINL